VHRDVYTIVFTRGLKAREDFVNDLAKRSALTGGGGLVCALIISWLLARRLSRRLDDLARSARNAVNGATDALEVDGADEIAALATAINTLVRSVKDAADHQQELFRYAGHELRTPLTAAMLNTDILIRHHAALDAAEQLVLLKTLRDQLSGLERVSDEVADIASGAARTHVAEPLELLAEARSAGEAFSLAHQHHVIVEGDDVTVMADAQELKRVIENLLSNAVKYGGDDPIEMNVTRAGHVGVLTVWDHGVGFNEQETGVLVEPFRRGRNVQSIPGSGLGLAIVKAIVSSHGGTLELANHPSGGAYVTVTLPLAHTN
jgi:two-component system sensor histidine kinase MprB